jgi:hypothetical protein
MFYSICLKRSVVWLVWLLQSLGALLAQDTLRNIPRSPYSPNKAALYSAVLPGAGQIYVKKYWKVPIIYAACIGTGTVVYLNHKQYKYAQTELDYRNKNNGIPKNPELQNVSSDVLRSYAEERRRYRDLFAIVSVLVYTGNIIDAYVDAHLSTYDISDDLSLRIKLGIQCYSNVQTGIGITAGLYFK